MKNINDNNKRGREEDGWGRGRDIGDVEEQLELRRAFSQEQPSQSMLQQKQRKTASSKKWHRNTRQLLCAFGGVA